MPMNRAQPLLLDFETSERLANLAAVVGSTVTALAAEAIKSYLELNEYQILEIRAALEEADRGDFASPEEVRATFAKWGVRGA